MRLRYENCTCKKGVFVRGRTTIESGTWVRDTARDEDIRVSIKAVRRSLSIFHHGVIDISHVHTYITVKTISRFIYIFMKRNNMQMISKLYVNEPLRFEQSSTFFYNCNININETITRIYYYRLIIQRFTI